MAKDRYWKIPICYDDDEDDTIIITPIPPIEEPVNSLSMGDKHLDTIPETESDEFIKSSVEILVQIPSEFREDDQSSLFAYVVWIFLAFLTYPVVPPYLLSTGNEDTIFDPGISIYHSFMPDVPHRNGTFMKFNVYPNRLNERQMMILSSTCFPMDQ
ncbi:hypothetical protein Tco_0650591 [Tanacetum coccineum]